MIRSVGIAFGWFCEYSERRQKGFPRKSGAVHAVDGVTFEKDGPCSEVRGSDWNTTGYVHFRVGM